MNHLTCNSSFKCDGQEDEEFLDYDQNYWSNDTETEMVDSSGYPSYSMRRTSIRNVTLYPPCWSDEDCTQISEVTDMDYKCLQYMCYPWQAKDGPFRKGVSDGSIGSRLFDSK